MSRLYLFTSLARVLAVSLGSSRGPVGDACDKTLEETVNSLYKAECVRTTVLHDGSYKTIADVEWTTITGSTLVSEWSAQTG